MADHPNVDLVASVVAPSDSLLHVILLEFLYIHAHIHETPERN